MKADVAAGIRYGKRDRRTMPPVPVLLQKEDITMFKKTDMTAVIQNNDGKQEVDVYAYEQEAYVKLGSKYLQILSSNRLNYNGKYRWYKFYNSKGKEILTHTMLRSCAKEIING